MQPRVSVKARTNVLSCCYTGSRKPGPHLSLIRTKHTNQYRPYQYMTFPAERQNMTKKEEIAPIGQTYENPLGTKDEKAG